MISNFYIDISKKVTEIIFCNKFSENVILDSIE